MPDEIIHQSQATHNERLAEQLILSSPQFADWVATACFYVALHLVDGYLARLGIHPKTHGMREREIQTHLPHIEHDYMLLKQHSLDARYEGVQMDLTTAFRPDFVENLMNTELEAIKNYIASLP